MKLPQNIQPGQVVTCKVRDREFDAEVVARTDDGLDIRPLSERITYYHVSARQVRKVHRWNPATTQHSA